VGLLRLSVLLGCPLTDFVEYLFLFFTLFVFFAALFHARSVRTPLAGEAEGHLFFVFFCLPICSIVRIVPGYGDPFPLPTSSFDVSLSLIKIVFW